jgi:hypothetical protein
MLDPTYTQDVVHPIVVPAVNKEMTRGEPTAKEDGITHVPHVRHKRVTRPATWKKSLFIDYNKRNANIVSGFEQDAYNQITRFGRHSRSKKNRHATIFFHYFHLS